MRKNCTKSQYNPIIALVGCNAFPGKFTLLRCDPGAAETSARAPQGTRVRIPPPGRSPCSRSRLHCAVNFPDAGSHAGPHTSAWPLVLLASAASLCSYCFGVDSQTGPHASALLLALLASSASVCVSVWETAFRVCTAAHSVLALQAE